MLASLPPQQVRALFPSHDAFVQRHGIGPTRLSGLRSVLTQVRRDGFATEDGTVTPDFASVAAPVLDHSGHPVAGIAVTFPAAEVTKDQRRYLVEQVIRTAADLTRRVGGHV